MTNEIEVIEETIDSVSSWLGDLRHALSTGAKALAERQEKFEGFIAKVLERGEIADGDARRLANTFVERRLRAANEGKDKARQIVDKRIKRVLSRMGIPTQTEIDQLGVRIAELSHRVNELKVTARK